MPRSSSTLPKRARSRPCWRAWEATCPRHSASAPTLQHSPANDPSYRIVRDSSRMVLAKQMEYAARMAYLAARRAEYEYAARLSASNFRISDIYRARTADDIKRYLQQMRSRIDNLPGGVTNTRDLTISLEATLQARGHELSGSGYVENTYTPSWRQARAALEPAHFAAGGWSDG